MNETIDYQKQGTDFLKETGIRFKVSFVDHAPYFEDDKESRDIYRITLSRRGRSFSFKFGQSINETGKTPRPYDVLSCIEKSDPGTFEDFCWNMGYDQDSLRVERIYKAVVKQWHKVSGFFNQAELDILKEIA